MLHRTVTLAVACATLATLTMLHAPATAQVLRVDPKTLPLPLQQPKAAAQLVHCHLDSAESCQFILEVLLDAPFAWQHAGYQIHLAYHPERGHPCGAVSDTGKPPTGCASSSRKEIWLYPGWVRHLEQGRRLGVAEPARALLRTLAHEVGHTFHQACPDERSTLQQYRQQRGISSRAPLRGHRASEGARFASVAEDFAEAAMVYLLDGLRHSRSPLAPGFEPADLEQIAEQFFRFCLQQLPDTAVSAASAASEASDPLAPHPWLQQPRGTDHNVGSPTACSSSMCATALRARERVGAAGQVSPSDAASTARWEAMARYYGRDLG